MLLSGGAKERLLSRICKLAGRRKAGMLLLLLVSAVVFCSLFSVVTKDEDTAPGIEITLNPGWTFSGISSSPYVHPKEKILNTITPIYERTHIREDRFQDFVRNFPPSAFFEHHPCENFTFSSPPLDRKRTGPRPCPVCYVSVEQAMVLMPHVPSTSPVLKNLNYLFEEHLIAKESNGGSLFGGFPSLQQRDESFGIKESMTVPCGFVSGSKPGQATGFDIDAADLFSMEQCHGIVVASAIFGNYDVLQQPENISEYSKETVCFYMFLDEETEAVIKNSTSLDSTKRIGLWNVVVVHNLPYLDARRNGKVPKLLLHRLFPNVRYSLWIDGKLKLVRDPYQILERFLWRQNVSFAISRHYRRFDVFEEAEANKAGGKYDNASIDYQIEFYKREGLTHYSSAKLPITSDVPEGCVIIKEHIPVTNLFTCLWFNEVDRFTSRDQLSFSTVRDKIRSKVNWTADMFQDCERRDFVVQIYHRELLQQRMAALSNPPPPVTRELPRKLVPENASPKKLPSKTTVKRGKDRKSSSKRRRPKATTGKENA